MNSDDMVRREKEIFFGALERPAGGPRTEYIEAMCGGDEALLDRVQALLHAHEHAPGFLPGDPGAAPSGSPPELGFAEELPGDWIGRYRLVEQVGEGGWGVVYRAEQETPVRRQVALKIVKLGMDTRNVIARFEAERQALALMDHPNIAHVLDAGATATGRPYFVMEFVDGVKVTEYCDENVLSIEERLKLFTRVCSAVQHAHQKGIIHRDLKPSNILVTERDGRPEPVVIDFGIAKAVSGESLTGQSLYTYGWQVIGTPSYMSPEQAASDRGGDLDTRSDIYCLGVLLYELLVGVPPFECRDSSPASTDEVRRRIREDDPMAPSRRISTLEHQQQITAARRRGTEPGPFQAMLRGDLDWICLKCLEKDRENRYETAPDLAADVNRYLTNEPVSARSHGLYYRSRKFVRRHRLGVAVALVLLVAGAVLLKVGVYSYWAVLEARDRERIHRLAAETAQAEAEARSRDLEQVATFQGEMLRGIDPAEMGAQLRDDVLTEAEAAMERAGHSPEQQAERMAQLEDLLNGANFINPAARSIERNILRRAIDAISREFPEQPLIQARLLQTVGRSLYSLGLLEQAVEAHEKALEIRRRVLGDEHPDTLDSLTSVGTILHVAGHYGEAERRHREALEIARELHEDGHPTVLKAKEHLGGALFGLNRHEESLVYKEKALDGFRRHFGNDALPTLMTMHRLGYTLIGLDREEEAENYFREAIEGQRRILGAEHPDAIRAYRALALVLYHQEKFDEAEPVIRETLEISRRIHGEEHRDTILAMTRLADVLRRKGDVDEAGRYLREAVGLARRSPSGDQRNLFHALSSLGWYLSEQGKDERAEAVLREAIDLGHSVFGRHLYVSYSMHDLGEVLRRQGRVDETETWFRKALEIAREVSGEDDPEAVDVPARRYADLLVELGRPGEAKEMWEDILETRESALGSEHSLTRDAALRILQLLIDQERFAEAERYYDKAVPGRGFDAAEDHPVAMDTIHRFGDVLRQRGRYDEAEEYMLEAIALRREALGEDHRDLFSSYHHLGRLYRDAGDLGEAERFLRKAIDHGAHVYDGPHHHIADACMDLGNVLSEQEELNEAREYLEQAREIREEVLGEDNFETIRTIHVLGDMLRKQGRFEEAEEYMLEALEQRRALDEEHRHVFYSLHHLGRLYRDWDQLDKAERYLSEATEFGRRVLGEEHPYTAQATLELAHVHREQQHFDEAKRLYAQAAKRFRARVHPEGASGAISEIASAVDGYVRAVIHTGAGGIEPLREALRPWDETLRQIFADDPSVLAGLRGLALERFESGAVRIALDVQALILDLTPADHPEREEYETELHQYQAALDEN